MAVDCFAPIDICTMQFDRLDCDGTILTGPEDRVVTCDGVSIKWVPTLLAADNQVSRNGSRGICAKRDIPAAVEEWVVTITLCPRIDVALYEMLNLAEPVIDEAGITGGAVGDLVGIKDGAANQPCACVLSDCSNAGVSILLWTNATDQNGIKTTKPYSIGAFTRVRFDTPSFASLATYTNVDFVGHTTPNPNWNRGPGNVYPELAGLDGAWADWNTNQPPPVNDCSCEACGYAMVS